MVMKEKSGAVRSCRLRHIDLLKYAIFKKNGYLGQVWAYAEYKILNVLKNLQHTIYLLIVITWVNKATFTLIQKVQTQ